MQPASTPKARALAALGVLLLAVPLATLAAPQPNAWQINDNSSLPGTIQYAATLDPTQLSAAAASGWRYAVQARVLSDSISSGTHAFAFDNGTRRFQALLDIDSSGQLTAQLLSSSNVTYVLTNVPLQVTKYHLHEFLFDPGTGYATYQFNGGLVATWAGHPSTLASNHVIWGATAASGRGVVNYRYARLEIPGTGPVATYDAGFTGEPEVAPSPTEQGWTRLTNGFPILESPLSPDSEFILPTAITLTPVFVRPGQALFPARINPNGLPANYWFDHGPTFTNGNGTPIGALEAGMEFVSVTNLVTGLPRGVPYHVQAMASNAVFKSAGTSVNFVTPADSDAGISTGPAGGNDSISLLQPTLELNFVICTNGSYPVSDFPVPRPVLGEIRMFAGNFAPARWVFCHGQKLASSNHLALFSLLGTTYGGDSTNFALPDLRLRTITGHGTGPGLPQWSIAQRSGTTNQTLHTNQLPAHAHPVNRLELSGASGSSYPRSIQQPSFAIPFLVQFTGANAPLTNQVSDEPMLGQIVMFGGAGLFYGCTRTFGDLLSINSNPLLYSILGTNFGGNGTTTFALPDLRGRTPMGVGQGFRTQPWALGERTGSSTATLVPEELPSHQHTIPWELPFSVLTGPRGDNQPHNIMQPSLAMRFLVATNGDTPSPTVPASRQWIGQILLFGGIHIPGGWTPCDGQVLSVSDHPSLFAVLSNRFGGNGIDTFALPNLGGRIPAGSLNGEPGASYGSETVALTEGQMPFHTHAVPKLDFDRWVTAFGLVDLAAAIDADPDSDGGGNAFEWATASNPTNWGSALLSISRAETNVFIHFPRNTNATDVTLYLERTSDLQDPGLWSAIGTNQGGIWNPLEVVETGTNNPVKVSVPDTHTLQPAAIYRLKVN